MKACLRRYASGGELFDYIVAKGRVPELEAATIVCILEYCSFATVFLLWLKGVRVGALPGMPLLPSDYCRLGEGSCHEHRAPGSEARESPPGRAQKH